MSVQGSWWAPSVGCVFFKRGCGPQGAYLEAYLDPENQIRRATAPGTHVCDPYDFGEGCCALRWGPALSASFCVVCVPACPPTIPVRTVRDAGLMTAGPLPEEALLFVRTHLEADDSHPEAVAEEGGVAGAGVSSE
jgi:hypothetical protein